MNTEPLADDEQKNDAPFNTVFRDKLTEALTERDNEGREATEVEAKTPPTVQPESEAAELPAVETIAPPKSWTAEAKEAFSKLPPDLQKIVSERDSERDNAYATKAQELAKFQREYDEIAAPLKEWDAHFKSLGLTNGQAVGQLLGFYHEYTTNPAGLIAHIAKESGVDLGQLVQGTYKPPVVDPTVMRLQQQVQSLVGERQEQESQRLTEAVDSFAQAKDANGELLRPYWDEVFDEIQIILTGMKQVNPDLFRPENMHSVLDAAYQKAVRANDATFQKLQAKSEAERIAQEKQKAAKAEKASVSIRPKAGVVPSIEGKGDFSSNLRKNLSEAGLI